jgi:RNA polymerase sigma-70 factor (ECF subfamily)
MGTSRSDEDLVRGIKEGDLKAFSELVRRHERPLINFFYRQTWDKHRAEDMAQEIFLRLYRAMDRYDPRAKFTTYLYTMARNLWIDRIRSVMAQPKVASLDNRVGGSETEARELIPINTPEPGDAAERIEEMEDVRRALNQLPEEYRVVVLLAEFQQMRYQEIGEVLGIPVGTVKSRMHHAIERLKELLK